MKKNLEDIFFIVEVLFLTGTLSASMYSIMTDKDIYLWVILLGMYTLTIKALRRIFTNQEEMKKVKEKVITISCILGSVIGMGYVGYAVINSMTIF